MLDYNGPYGRYYRAKDELKKNSSLTPSTDIWVQKTQRLLRQRSSYKDKDRYKEDNPLFSSLLEVFLNDKYDSPKHLLEAYLITECSFAEIAIKLQGILDANSLYVSLYHEMFYNIRKYLSDDIAMHKYIVQPLLHYNSTDIALPEIWKLLAYKGGKKLLERSGIGGEVLSPDDLNYLLHLSSFRNITNIINYTSKGFDAFGENVPFANLFVNNLLSYESSRTSSRNADGFKRVSNTSQSQFSSSLTGMFTVRYGSKDITPELKKLEGTFQPEYFEAVEVCNPVLYEKENEEVNKQESLEDNK